MSASTHLSRFFCLFVAVITTAALMTPPSAQAAAFTETFAAPPLTAGTSGTSNGFEDWEDGLVNGDNGWAVIETPNTGQNFGQRSPGVTANSPNGAFVDVGNVRMRNTGVSAFMVRDLAATPLVSGNVSMRMLDALANFGLGTSGMRLLLSTDGGATTAVALEFGNLNLGSVASGAGGANDRFEVVQIGGAATVVANTATQTTDNRDLHWWGVLDGSTATGNYVELSVDFDVNTSSASVVITTVDATGSASSTAPVAVSFQNSVTEISRIAIQSLDSTNSHSAGSLVWLDEFSYTGIVPEPASLALLSLGCLVVLGRKR